VALLDSGIDPDHLDLKANYRGGYDFVNDDPLPWDDNGHGTEVAGVLAARENGFGLIGVAPQAELFAVKVLGSDARGTISDVAKGLEWAIQHGMQVVNMSLGTLEDSRTLREAVHAAWEAGLVLVAPVGNESGRVLYPAAYDEVIAVAATDKDDRLAWFSNFGPQVELAAPGEEVPTTYPGNRYQLASGTSFAAPHVAGVAALLISSGIEDNREVRARLDQTAEELGLPHEEVGFGLVDAAHAVLGTAVGDN
jgi:subtilisin